MRLRSVIASSGLAPLLIAAAQPLRLQPSSQWVVDYAENSCRLVRVFGAGETETKMAFESSAPDSMDLLVVGKPLKTSLDQVPARFLPVGGKTTDGRVAETATGRDPAILWGSGLRTLPDAAYDAHEKERKLQEWNGKDRPPPIDLGEVARYKAMRAQFYAGVSEMEIQTRRGRPVILETGSLGPAMAAYDKCNRDSLKDWGVNPDIEDKIVRGVWARSRYLTLSETDYPPAMITQRKESEVAVRVLVDATGKVTKCTSLSHFVDKDFDRATCAAITRRARFEPAELADGTKVPSYMTQRVVFRIAY